MPAPTWMYARPPVITIVRRAIHVSMFPEKSTYPTAPAYGPRRVGSNSSMISIARIFGAPLTVPTGSAARRASNAVLPAASLPLTSETMCIT